MTDAITYEWTGAPDASPSVKRVNGVITRKNLVRFPSATVVENIATNVNGGAATSSSQSRAEVPSGVAAVASWTAPSNGAWNSSIQQDQVEPVVGGHTYAVSLYGGQSWSGNVQLTIGWVMPNFTVAYLAVNDTSRTVPPNRTIRLAGVTTAPPEAIGMQIFWDASTPSVAGGQSWLSSFLVEDGAPVGPYFDGNSRVGTTYRWTGDAFISSSVKAVDGAPVRINMATFGQPSAPGDNLGQGRSGWTGRWFGNGGGEGVGSLVTGATDGPVPGITKYVRKAWTVMGSAVQDVGYSHTGGPWSEGVPVAGMSQVTVSSYIRASKDQPDDIRFANVIQADVFDAQGNLLPTETIDTYVAPKAGKWVRYVRTFNLPTNAAFLSNVFTQVYLDATTWSAGDTLDGTGLLIEETGAARDYFDGSFPWDLYAFPSRTSTSTSTAAGLTEFTPSVTRKSTSTLTHAEASEFLSIVSRNSESESAAWGSVPALLNVDYDSVGPFWVGDSPLTAWAIEVDSEVNLFGVFDSGEVTILDPTGQVVAVRPSPFIDSDTLIVTIPVGTFTTAGVYRLVPRLIGRGSVTLESVPVVVQADDGWHGLESARQTWPEAPTDDEALYRLLETARIQCEEFAPAFIGRAPVNYAAAQLMQARALWSSGNVRQDDQMGGGQLTVTVFPMDWTVKALLRPKRAIGVFF